MAEGMQAEAWTRQAWLCYFLLEPHVADAGQLDAARFNLFEQLHDNGRQAPAKKVPFKTLRQLL